MGIYRVWSNAISYGTMTMFLSLSGTLTSSVNSLVSLIPSAISLTISLTISAGRLMDIVKMPQEDYSQDTLVQSFEKQHKAEGIGLNMQNLSYTYHNGTSVFADASIELILMKSQLWQALPARARQRCCGLSCPC